MVYVRGKARIRHAETGEIFEVDANQIDFESSAGEERGMGPETTYSAVVHHPQLGQLAWYLWEYPIGAENDRETDVAQHELLENIDYGLGPDPPDDDYRNAATDDDDEDRQARIDALVEWFFERYEDPAHRLPHVSAEGGYQWIYGGPYDAREVLGDNFSDEPEDIIEAAVEEIEADGLTDWAPVPSSDDYHQDNEEPLEDEDSSDIAGELAALIAALPEPSTEPVFRAGDDGLIHMVVPLDAAVPGGNDPVLEELYAATNDLLDSLAGTNAHTDLLEASQRYSSAINGETISISRVYVRGVRLANAADATRSAIARDELPPLPQNTDAHLSSVLDLNRAYIMAQPDGRELAEGADAYRRTPAETEAMRAAAASLAEAIEDAADLFGEDVRRQVAEAAADVGRGPQPERSNQSAATTFGNLTARMLKGVGGFGMLAAAAIGGQAITGSAPGGALAAGGSQLINLAWTFLVTHASTLHTVAVVFGADLSWLTPVSHLLQRAKRLRD